MNKRICTLLGLALLTACGGGDGGSGGKPTPAPFATILTYTDPAAVGPRLVRNAALSTTSRLVFDLIGPAGTPIRGMALPLMSDATKVDWVPPVDDNSLRLVLDCGVIPLGSTPQLRYEQLDPLNRGSLDMGLFQKGGTPTQLGEQAILRLALRLRPSTPIGPIDLAVAAGRQLVVADANGALNGYVVKIGALRAD